MTNTFYYLTSILILLSVQTTVQAQWSIGSQTLFSEIRDDKLRHVVSLESGNFMTVGINDSDFENHQGLYDFWLVQFDASFNIIWQNVWGGPGEDITESFIESNDGGFIVVGTTDSLGGQVNTYQGNTDGWVIKVSNTGELLWTQTFGGTGTDVLEDIVAVADGYVLIGHTNSGEITDSLEQDETDIWLIKINESGELLWQKNYGSLDDDEGKSIILLDNGKLMTASFIREATKDVETHIASKDFWITQLSQEGYIEKQWTFGGNKADVPTKLIQVQDNRFAITGETFSEFDDAKGGGDIWVMEFDTLGTTLQAHTIGGSSLDIPKSMVTNDAGDLIIVGETFSINGDIITAYSTLNAFVTTINSTQNTNTTQVFGGNQFDAAWDITPIQGSNDNYLVVGYTDSYDGDLAWKHGNHDAWLFTLEAFTSLHAANPAPKPFTYRNNTLHFSTSNSPKTIELYDLQGKQCFQQKTIEQAVALPNTPTGIYLVRIICEEGIYTHKIVLKE